MPTYSWACHCGRQQITHPPASPAPASSVLTSRSFPDRAPPSASSAESSVSQEILSASPAAADHQQRTQTSPLAAVAQALPLASPSACSSASTQTPAPV